ncbi:type I polyketide synthase [Chitinimonas koreensis]|nr:type I polyketide synthase [Chitinimonas koreensis]
MRALRSGECDAVLAGGASVSVPQRVGYLYEDGSILSPDGRCRAFGIDAAGTVPGNGVGVVVLKRLSRALADGDPIRAVIRAVALNNDGADKVGFSAPSVGGQEEVLQAALREAGLDAADIGYVETHGTGTRLGDEVELSALAGAFGGAGQGARCLIGSLKSNLGHLDAAAGVAGLIKAVLTVERGIVPASLHVEQPNALLAAGGSRFALATATVAWPDDGRPRRAGVSSFGIGGTNAHCIVEQPPRPAGPERQASEPREQLLLLSALDAAALERQRSRLAAALADDADLAAVAWTLQRGRQILPLRLAVTARTAAEARSALLAAPLPAAAAPAEAPALYFAFPGQGSQRAGMGHAIYAAEPAFRALADACLALLPAELAAQVRLAAFADPAEAGAEAEALLARTEVAQPALFVHQYALARLLLDWGLRPAGLLGHSLGEIVAAALAGVLTPPDAIQLVVRRARLMQDSAEGAMLQAELPAAELAALLPDGLAIAACNGPALTVAAGPVAQVEAFAAQLDARGVAWQRLRGRHAFHSPAMAPAAAALRPWLATLTAHPPQWPLLSNLDGGWMSDAEAVDPQRWARQLCAPVQFAPALAELAGRPGALLLEIGAGTTLAAFARQAGLAALSLPAAAI